MCPLWLLPFVSFACKNFCNFKKLFSKTTIAIPFHLLRVCLLFYLLCYLYLRVMFERLFLCFTHFGGDFHCLNFDISKRFSNQFRSPRSMRFVADMNIQMILGESTSLIAAVGFIQLYNFMYNRSDDIYIFFGLQ